MAKYIMRLDDACEKRDINKWNHMEKLLDQYGIKPLVGVIPHCEDPMMDKYPADELFWNRVKQWINKGWTVAMHGYNHVYGTQCGGINPINLRSEFAGESLEVQAKKIKKGIAIFHQNRIDPHVFFAPSHTFDENTLIALKNYSNIRIISDTIATAPYTKQGFMFIPQQSGKVRKLPFHTITFCYHPNMMQDDDFKHLETFLQNNKQNFVTFPIEHTKRRYNMIDALIRYLYIKKHRK